MATLKLANINKVYPNNVQAVFDFNIDIKDKEFIVFVGPSGCGKSTTLRMVAGLEQITEGDLYIDDERMNAIEPKARNIAMVFQNYALYPHMTVYNNMAFALKLRKVNKPVYAIDKKNPDYLTKKKELYESYKKKLEEGLAKLKSERAVQLRKKEFKFDAKNALRVELLHLDEKYAKPVLTYDKDKVDQLLDVIKQEKNKKNDLVTKLTKEIKAEQNKPQTEVDSLSKEVKKQENALVSLTKEYQKIIKRAYEPERIKELENELKATTLKFEKKIANLKKQLDDAGKLKVDEKKIAELNKQLEAANSLTIDENKIKQLEDEIAAVKAKENVQAYRFAHYNKNEIAAKVTEAANILGLTQYLLRKPAALSGGQRQRVALGRSIVRKPKVFLMDEPLSNLDAKLRVQMRTELTKIHKDVKATTIYVTHDQTEAMTMANRIVVMKAGYVQQIATPEEVYAHPANLFVATFIGSPAMNIIKGVYDGKALNIDNKLKITLPPSFKKVHNQFYVDQKEISLKEIQKISDDLDRILEKKKLKKHMSAIKQREELLATHRNIIENCDKCLKAKSHELYFGIRPEDIYLPKDKNNHNPSNKFKVKVDSYELLGHELNIYSKLAGSNFVFRISANNKVNESSNLEVCLDLKKIHIFDIASTKRIG